MGTACAVSPRRISRLCISTGNNQSRASSNPGGAPVPCRVSLATQSPAFQIRPRAPIRGAGRDSLIPSARRTRLPYKLRDHSHRTSRVTRRSTSTTFAGTRKHSRPGLWQPNSVRPAPRTSTGGRADPHMSRIPHGAGRLRAFRRSGPLSEPGVPVSEHPAQASAVGSCAGRSAGPPRTRQRICMRRGSLASSCRVVLEDDLGDRLAGGGQPLPTCAGSVAGLAGQERSWQIGQRPSLALSSHRLVLSIGRASCVGVWPSSGPGRGHRVKPRRRRCCVGRCESTRTCAGRRCFNSRDSSRLD